MFVHLVALVAVIFLIFGLSHAAPLIESVRNSGLSSFRHQLPSFSLGIPWNFRAREESANDEIFVTARSFQRPSRMFTEEPEEEAASVPGRAHSFVKGRSLHTANENEVKKKDLYPTYSAEAIHDEQTKNLHRSATLNALKSSQDDSAKIHREKTEPISPMLLTPLTKVLYDNLVRESLKQTAAGQKSDEERNLANSASAQQKQP